MLDLVEEPLEQELDALYIGGTVVDPESGLHGIRNVGIRDGIIEYIGRLEPKCVHKYNVSGKIVSPGFIDMHSHAQSLNGHRLQALDGVTTSLELEAGTLPVKDAYEWATTQGRPTNFGFSASWSTARVVARDDVDPNFRGISLNYQTLPGWSGLASGEEVAKIVGILEEGIDQGALGIGSLLGYSTDSGRVEFYEMAKLAARRNVQIFSHIRSSKQTEPKSNTEAVLELVAVAAATGAQMHMCHVNSTSARLMDTALDIIQHAQNQGLHVTSEFYPYGAFSTGIGAEFLSPEEIVDSAVRKYSNVRFLPQLRNVRDGDDWYALRDLDPGAACVASYLDENDPKDMAMLYHAMSFPGLAVASDAMWFASTGDIDLDEVETTWPLPSAVVAHPRTAGTFSRAIRMGIDTGIWSIDEAIARCSLTPARILEQTAPAMKHKGRIQLGMDADIAIFDPNAICDKATYDQLIPSVGFEWVLVAGVPVVHDSVLIESALPGKPITNQFV